MPVNCPVAFSALNMRRARVLRAPYAVLFAVAHDHGRIGAAVHEACGR
jgi:hypothetical protein